jgi:excisionase family DNA binding protein
MEQIEGKNYLTILEIMERLGLSRSTIYRYVSNGKFDVIEIGGKIYITEESYKNLFIPKNKKIKNGQHI